MKKTISVVLVIALLSAVFFISQSVFGLEQETDIPLTQLGTSSTYYSFDASTKTLTISGEGAMPNFTNVDSGDTAQPWYTWRSDGSIENVVVEEGITSLGNYAFYFVSATDFSLPTTLTQIGNYAMSGTNGITEITLPAGLTRLGNDAFYFCSNLERVVLPASLTVISTSCFENCTALESVEFPKMNMQVSIYRRAFTGCSSLTEITLPKGATLGNYAYGYQKAQNGKTYDDVLMRVYRDSPAYDYANSNLIDYELISDMELFQGETAQRTFYSDSVGSPMVFTFNPTVTALYDFYSNGSIDVDCSVEDSQGNVIASASDNSNMDLNFTLTASLSAGETYYFIVSSVQATGDYSVTLYPHTISTVQPCFTVELPAYADSPHYYDVASEIDGELLDVTFNTGFTERIVFSQNSAYSLFTVSYSDNQNRNPFTCGNNYGSISIGQFTVSLTVKVNHSYEMTVVERTFEHSGYTQYECIGCHDTYFTDYQKRIGVMLTGTVLLAESPACDCQNAYPVSYAEIYADGQLVGTADANGSFTVYVEDTVESVVISTPSSVDRTLAVYESEFNEIPYGDIPLVNFDLCKDGYVNAKDYAKIRALYGAYDSADHSLAQLDCNGDGVISDSDFKGAGALSFYAAGRLTQSVYGA